MNIKALCVDNKWESLNIDIKSVNTLLQWPWLNSIYYEWPPHNYPWSSRDEREILLLCSTKFKSLDDFKEWLQININSSLLNDEHHHFLEWLYPEYSLKLADEYNQDQDQLLQYFLLNCILRSLLWWDPSPTWPSDLKGAVWLSFDILEEWYKNKHIYKSKSIKALSYLDDTGWVQWQSEPFIKIVQTTYDMLKFVANIDNITKNQVIDFSHQVKESLLASVESLWLYGNNYKDWEYSEEDNTTNIYSLTHKRQSLMSFNKIINKEKTWFENNIEIINSK